MGPLRRDRIRDRAISGQTVERGVKRYVRLNEGQERLAQFLVAGRKATGVFQRVEETLHFLASLVLLGVIGTEPGQLRAGGRVDEVASFRVRLHEGVGRHDDEVTT